MTGPSTVRPVAITPAAQAVAPRVTSLLRETWRSLPRAVRIDLLRYWHDMPEDSEWAGRAPVLDLTDDCDGPAQCLCGGALILVSPSAVASMSDDDVRSLLARLLADASQYADGVVPPIPSRAS
ncbi:hypothetical protein [Aquisphaera insulae]|uniref:hypothetical protein n=1 Tax=Aquisphaera insulae TaxID=2712864 RepID=UPI0013EB8E19|nr:hypothetical protein [Aquisphaera insulae]